MRMILWAERKAGQLGIVCNMFAFANPRAHNHTRNMRLVENPAGCHV